MSGAQSARAHRSNAGSGRLPLFMRQGPTCSQDFKLVHTIKGMKAFQLTI